MKEPTGYLPRRRCYLLAGARLCLHVALNMGAEPHQRRRDWISSTDADGGRKGVAAVGRYVGGLAVVFGGSRRYADERGWPPGQFAKHTAKSNDQVVRWRTRWQLGVEKVAIKATKPTVVV